jgi:hypothetical protein
VPLKWVYFFVCVKSAYHVGYTQLYTRDALSRLVYGRQKVELSPCAQLIKSIPGTTRKKKSSGSGTGSTQPREYNWGAAW